MCERYNIKFVEHEESYTLKADFLANDYIPNYKYKNGQNHSFSGKRISRGQYQSATGVIINADVNGYFNIMRKANVTNICLVCKEYLNPLRINLNKRNLRVEILTA